MNHFRRTSNFPGGIACGGGDTGWTEQSQPMLLTKRVEPGVVAKAALPKGMTVLEVWVLTDPDAPSTAGTLDIVDTTNSVLYANAIAVSAPSRSVLTTSGALTEDTAFDLITTGADGAVIAGFYVVPQRSRP